MQANKNLQRTRPSRSGSHPRSHQKSRAVLAFVPARRYYIFRGLRRRFTLAQAAPRQTGGTIATSPKASRNDPQKTSAKRKEIKTQVTKVVSLAYRLSRSLPDSLIFKFLENNTSPGRFSSAWWPLSLANLIQAAGSGLFPTSAQIRTVTHSTQCRAAIDDYSQVNSPQLA